MGNPPRLDPQAAHDLRSLVNAVSLALEVAELDREPERSHALEIARARTRSLSDLIDDLAGTRRPPGGAVTALQPLPGGARVLVVEDDYLLAQSVADHLRRCGCDVLGPVGTVEGALELLAAQPVDCGIVDANLGGHFSSAVVEALAARGIPASVLSGYDRSALPEALQRLVFLQKPVNEAELARTVAALVR